MLLKCLTMLSKYFLKNIVSTLPTCYSRFKLTIVESGIKKITHVSCSI